MHLEQRDVLIKESLWFSAGLAIGAFLLPIAVYVVGIIVFGEYAGSYRTFFQLWLGRIVSFSFAAWLVALSPWLLFVTLRLTAFAYQYVSQNDRISNPDPLRASYDRD